MAGFDGNVKGKVTDLVSPELNKVVRSFQSQIYVTNKKIDDLQLFLDVEEIDLSSQCDGATTAFALGKTVKAFIAANLNGTITAATLNTAKTQITLTIAPDSGEELSAIVII